MNLELVEKVANAVLYEGYMLYPYTASSVKNRQRWNFGVLHPPSFDTGEMRTECLAIAGDGATLGVCARFLQSRPGDQVVERRIEMESPVTELLQQPLQREFSFQAAERLQGEIEISAARLEAGAVRIAVRIANRTPFEGSTRDAALLRSMLSTHTILTLAGGEFVSLIDPPGALRDAAAACRNTGTWPVLAGAQGERDMMLSSPIILYDYPQVASESPGDLFDSTEIDEILTLRILTLSDAEKAAIRAGDERARQVLERSEALPPEHLAKLHGALRGLRPASQSKFRPGGRVRLHPRRGADILDIALAGKIGIIEAVEQDFEGRAHLAVVLEDDPGRDLGMMRQPGHRFFFGADEVEPLP